MSLKDANEWAGQVIHSIGQTIHAMDNIIVLGAIVLPVATIIAGFVLILVAPFTSYPPPPPPPLDPWRNNPKNN